MEWDTKIAAAERRWVEIHGGTGAEASETGADGETLTEIAVTAADYREHRGNWPKLIHHRRPTGRAIVLVHGLTDSPAFVEAIGRAFAGHGGGCTVLLPLLPGHGRRAPERAIEAVSREDWRRVVDAAVEIARSLEARVSIGGFSTGGALAVDKTLRDPGAVDGKVFLFSAALDLVAIKDLFLGSGLDAVAEEVKDFITGNDGLGGDPCKYSRMYFHGAHQLEQLIADIQAAARAADTGELYTRYPYRGRVFVAHSEADETIRIDAVMPLVDRDDPGQHYLIARALGVGHSELVLHHPRSYVARFRDVPPPPRANPDFAPMIDRVLAFADR